MCEHGKAVTCVCECVCLPLMICDIWSAKSWYEEGVHDEIRLDAITFQRNAVITTLTS